MNSLLKLHPDAENALRELGIHEWRVSHHGCLSSDNSPTVVPTVELVADDVPDDQITTLLDALGGSGFAAWLRKPGYDGWPSHGHLHIYAIYAGCHMSKQIREQVIDFCHRRNGLPERQAYLYHPPSDNSIAQVSRLFHPTGQAARYVASDCVEIAQGWDGILASFGYASTENMSEFAEVSPKVGVQ